ncbi:MAG: hypothetical protein JWN86_1100 [Planctomycetota bacterium]|nr:hypothetical protein [Planctomycetota bacterium]
MHRTLLTTVLVCLAAGQVVRAGDIDKLKNSTWDTKYKGDGLGGTIKAYVYLNDDKGKYRALDDDGNVTLKGKFTDVEVKKKGDQYIISGRWEAGGLTGSFKFKVDEDDLNSFSGTWQTDDGNKEGTWKGTRKPVPFLP